MLKQRRRERRQYRWTLSDGPFPQGVALDALRPRPEETTVLGRLRFRIGPVKADSTPGRDLQRIGARVASRFRKQYAQEPPRVLENHPALGGDVSVFCYPGLIAVALLDEAIETVLTLEYGYVAPPPPPGHKPPPEWTKPPPATPWQPDWLKKQIGPTYGPPPAPKPVPAPPPTERERLTLEM